MYKKSSAFFDWIEEIYILTLHTGIKSKSSFLLFRPLLIVDVRDAWMSEKHDEGGRITNEKIGKVCKEL